GRLVCWLGLGGALDCPSGGSGKAREIELHRRAFAGLAVDLHMTARLLDEAINLRQAEAGALADLLCGEEGFKSLLGHFPRHARAGVRNGDEHILPRAHVVVCPGIGLVEEGVCGFYRELAAKWHGVARIDRGS